MASFGRLSLQPRQEDHRGTGMHKHGRAAQMRDLSVENRQRVSISAYIRLFTLWMRIHIKIGKPFGTASFRGETVVTLTADHAYKEGRFLERYYNAL